jgi:hypothetical protein
VFPLNNMQRLQRFLVLGYSGGTYYSTESDVQMENTDFIKRYVSLQYENRAYTVYVLPVYVYV